MKKGISLLPPVSEFAHGPGFGRPRAGLTESGVGRNDEAHAVRRALGAVAEAGD